MFEGQNYNCRPGDQEPDWSRYIKLELNGCQEGDECIIGQINRHYAEFFTIYGRLRGGGVESITDVVDDFDVAKRVAEEHACKANLPLTIVC